MKMSPLTAANHRRRIIRIIIRDHRRIVAGNNDPWLRFRYEFGKTGPQKRTREFVLGKED